MIKNESINYMKEREHCLFNGRRYLGKGSLKLERREGSDKGRELEKREKLFKK